MTEEVAGKSLYWQSVTKRAAESGKTTQEILNEDRKMALSSDPMSDDCVAVLSYDTDLARDGKVEPDKPFAINMALLPPFLKWHGEHLQGCERCQDIVQMAARRL